MDAVDRLTIVSHDRIQEIVDHTNDPESVIRRGVVIGRDIPEKGKTAVDVRSGFYEILDDKARDTTTLFSTLRARMVTKAASTIFQEMETLSSSRELENADVLAHLPGG